MRLKDAENKVDMAFDFLNNLGQSLANYFSPALSTVKNVFDELIPTRKAAAMGSSAVPEINVPQPSSTPQPASMPSAETYTQGFNNFGTDLPVASYAPQFAEAATQLPETIDPLLPAIIALMETGGGVNTAANNNPFNIRGIQDGQTQFIDYPDIATALLGGENQGVTSSGLLGQLLTNAAYDSFRQSGNLEDFFTSYTPPGEAYGNPSLDELIARYTDLRDLFPGY